MSASGELPRHRADIALISDLRNQASRHSGLHAYLQSSAPATGTSEYQNPIRNPYRWCRVRRKRKRLTSNGSIESDAAVGLCSTPEVYLAASLPIEC